MSLAIQGTAKVVNATPQTKTANYEIQTTDFGVGKSIRMTNAASRTFTFAALGAAQDGYRITLVKGGAGDVIVDAGALNIGDTSSGQLTNSGGAGAIGESVTLEYVHASTILLIVGMFGTWTEAA